ncbi:MAG TPA: hypothetical protein VKU94_06340 [Geobacterales bacterium]|nr:hypothetical protein [Geobacterales bacterium]
MNKRAFKTFNDLRKESYKIIKDYREKFVKNTLEKYNINCPKDISKQEFHNLMEKHKVNIIKNEKLNRDEIIINGNLIAYWNKNIELLFINGYLYCKINCWVA